MKTKDAYGLGLLAYQEGNHAAQFTVEIDIAETDVWDVATFFRPYDEMPELERRALSMCRGRVLDVGAGAGSHSLWLQDRGFDVEAVDLSHGAAEVMRRRGVGTVLEQDFFAVGGRRYDTLLMLMNGAGIVGTIDRLPMLFDKAGELLNEGGMILLDSSDLIYLYEDEDGSVAIDLNARYYGEIEYEMSFEGRTDEPFAWLFVDFDTLQAAAEDAGWDCRMVCADEHYQYLACITRKR